MAFTITISNRAYREYYKAYEWYEEKLLGLGVRFEDALERQIDQIAQSPLVYSNRKFDTRESKIEDFPFLIVYKIVWAENVILITSIFHTSRSPKKKYRK
jgi:plasmid stabilization system protein ParE